MRKLAAVATTISVISCTEEPVSNSMTTSSFAESHTYSPPAVKSPEVKAARIYFGHQSVGGNIVEGLRELGDGAISLPIIHSRDRNAGTSGLFEFFIGENGKPESKMKDFAAALDQIDDKEPAIALFKYCYLDITADTDVDVLFAKHRAAVRQMRERHPNLTFVHVTAPLTRFESAPAYFAKRLLRKATARDANARRTRFNAMLRAEYDSEPLFDLEKIESTRTDGSRSFVQNGSGPIYGLAPELTDDGGHLNANGRRVAAEEFAAMIAGVLPAR
jgi:hypothetical protein